MSVSTRVEDDRTRADLEFFPNRKKVDLDLVRCPSCGGLRTVSIRWMKTTNYLCKECSRGRVIHRKDFCAFWAERFTVEEIEQMAEAIWT